VLFSNHASSKLLINFPVNIKRVPRTSPDDSQSRRDLSKLFRSTKMRVSELKLERGLRSLITISIITFCISSAVAQQNPVFPGWYADPEGVIYDDKYWIFPTFSSDEQLHFDAFSSPDLANWTMHPRIIDNVEVTWAWKSMWAPSALRKDGKYYFFFSANAIDEETHLGGIGVAVSDKPEGPYKDLLGKPLINAIANRAQPIDQFVFQDVDGTYYMFYGGTILILRIIN